MSLKQDLYFMFYFCLQYHVKIYAEEASLNIQKLKELIHEQFFLYTKYKPNCWDVF